MKVTLPTAITAAMIAGLVVHASTAAAACRFPGEPGDASGIRLERIASGFARPVDIVFSPDRANTYYIVEQYGLLKAVVGGVVQTTPVLDLRDAINDSGNETGFLGLAFHPRFAENRRLFINYTTSGRHRSRISELSMDRQGRIDPASERVLLEVDQPYSNHNGGDLEFGPDGYLYIGLGDGGSGGDPHGHGQNLRSLLAKMLRIDVNGARPYAIPPTNPTFSDPQARREIYAYGLRNPWRYSFDRVTGKLWVGDVGQNALEEIDIVESGKNYGWNIMEGSACYRSATCNREGLTLPVHQYSHSEGSSVTGGYVYRGTAIPDLAGAYIYADYVSQTIRSLRYDGTRVTQSKLLLEAGIYISSFGQDAAGELYVLDHGEGNVYRIVAAGRLGPVSEFPRTVGATGCFASLSPLTPADGVESYDVSSPLWSDGLDKDRYVYVPSGSRGIRFSASSAFDFPEDTVLIKNFYAPTRGQRRIVETRFLVKRAGGFKGYTYRWDEQGRDGALLADAAYRDLTISTSAGDATFPYYYPSRTDCVRCHVPGVGGVLAFDRAHLNFDGQLHALARSGVIDAATVPSDVSRLGSLPNLDDQTATLEQRVRSYLHTQCAHCHNRDSSQTQGEFDLRYGLTLAQTGMCDRSPVAGDLGVAGAKIVKPGDPQRSLVWLRAHSLDRAVRMPPLASSRRDEDGMRLLTQWIMQLRSCP